MSSGGGDSATKTAMTVNVISWASFMVGFLIVTIAYLSVTYGGGQQKTLGDQAKIMKGALTWGTSIMYLSLLLMPVVPLLYHKEKKDINRFDYVTSGLQWVSYGLLPLALTLWDKPAGKSRIGLLLLLLSVGVLIASIFTSQKASKIRADSGPSPAAIEMLKLVGRRRR